MSAPRKFSDELRERASRMAVELRRDPATRSGAIRRVSEQLGMHPETLRNWVRQAEIDGGVRPGTTTDDVKRLAELEQENRELKRANEILRTASAFFAAAELDRKLK
jgi:transposase